MDLRSVKLSPLLVAALFLAGCSVDIQHSLTEQDANEIYVLLGEHGISARKQREEGGNEPTYMIAVPKTDASQAVKILRENSLPRAQAGGFGYIGRNKGMIPTAVEERAMLLDAISGEVTNALNKVTGVLEARVIVQIPEKSDLTQPDKKPVPTASALVKYRLSPDGTPPLKELQVKQFVAATVEELKPENVVVIMTEARSMTPEIDPSSRLQELMGLRMTADSASQFKTLVEVAALLIVAMAGVTAWTFVRGGGGGGGAALAKAKKGKEG